jgi:hypothetical protein
MILKSNLAFLLEETEEEIVTKYSIENVIHLWTRHLFLQQILAS